MIIQALQDLQSRHGYLPRRALHQLADRLAVPLYRIQEVASFYPHFTLFPDQATEDAKKQKLPKHEVAICRDMACRLRGSAQVTSALNDLPCVKDGTVAVHEVSCLGRCDRAPSVRMHTHDEDHTVWNFHGLPTSEIRGYVSQIAAEKADKTKIPDLRDELLPQPSDNWKINVYAGAEPKDRYAAIRKWIDRIVDPPPPPPAPPAGEKAKPARGEQKPGHPLIAALWTANLLGMGGAGGRAWKKWDEVLRATGETKYVVCNGDESEPGTFKDRELLLRTPYLVIEGVILAGLLLRAKKGILYIRHEYEEQIEALREELKEARRFNVCGDNILESGLSFDVEVFVSPGGYICGEQTALIQAIQDERAEPRNRPPELQTNGLWDCPTLLSNVETFAWVPSILTQGAEDGAWYSTLGQARATPVQGGLPHYQGARFFSVSGDVAKPGVYEVPVGITLGQLINDYCGGVRQGLKLKAVATSGPSAGFLPAAIPLDSFSAGVQKKLRDMGLVADGEKEFQLQKLPLELATVRELNIMVGAGLVVYAEGADLVDQAVAASRFYQAESCGKCVPCRIGSTKLVEIGEDLQAGALSAAEVESLVSPGGKVTELAQVMAETAICGLGNVAPNPLRTLLSYFPKDLAGAPSLPPSKKKG